MGQTRPNLLSALATACTLVLLASGSASAQTEEQLPILSAAEERCQTVINDATRRYVENVFVIRQECFNGQMAGLVTLAADCRAESPTGGLATGDLATDTALATARSRLLADVPAACTGVDLTVLAYPGFCRNVPEDRPFDVFDLSECLLASSDAVIAELIDFEQPGVDTIFPFAERKCRNEVSRKASIMFTRELETRQTCLIRQLKRKITELVDCRLEDDPLAPGTGDDGTDNGIVSAHNRNLRGISNACRPIFLNDIGFPNICPAPIGNVYPLSALRDCMFASHHFDIIRFLDIMNPLTTKCGNGENDFGEQCDDGDNVTEPGKLCRFDCSINSNCGDPLDTGSVTTSDVRFITQAAIGNVSCDLSLCDVDGDGFITVRDAQRALQFITGEPVTLDCPPPLSLTCGNGTLERFEECDDGDVLWTIGEECNASCLRLACGDPDDSGTIAVTDAVIVLRVAAGERTCDLTVCDVDGNGVVTVTDASILLQSAGGLDVPLVCPTF